MTATLFFQLVAFVSILIPVVLPVVVLIGNPWPHRSLPSGLLAVLLAWAASVAFTALVYNPAGLASAIELGVDSPLVIFDDNTVASQLLGGWIIPSLVVSLFFLGRSFFSRRKTSRSDG